MPTPSPPIAGPPYDDIAGRTEALARSLSPWNPAAGQVDAGRALIRVFDRMARHVIERLNRVPDRSFLAFLDLVGVEPAPTRPARVPLTFLLVERGGAEPVVPAGTRAGAARAPGDTREILFETTRELATTRARLAAAIVVQHEPEIDRWADRTAAATGEAPGFYEVFEATDAVEHDLYLAADEILLLPATTASVRLDFASTTARNAWGALALSWTYWNGAAWAPLPGAVDAPLNAASWTRTFAIPADLAEKVVDGRAARWIRARLTAWPAGAIPQVQAVVVSAAVDRSGLVPSLALTNGRPTDISMDFFPLGEQPRFNDTFYIASDEALSHPGAEVTISITASDQQAPELKLADAPVVSWEVSTANGWHQLGTTESTEQHANPAVDPVPNDVLREVTYTLPGDVAPAEVAGQRAHWLRIRLAGGSFGKGLYTVVTPGADPPVSLVDDGVRPPLLKTLTLGYVAIIEATPARLSYDDFDFTEHAGAGPFTPFQRAEHPTALYLGFSADRRFANRDTLLYFQVAPLSVEDAGVEAAAGDPPKVVWEYSTATGFAPLGAADETRAFARSGLLQFIGPVDLTARHELGQTMYWLRARLVDGTFAVTPRIGRVLTNTVWGTHTATITGEILGSSDGSAGQVFTLSHRPILEGQQIEVREPEIPPAAERVEIERVEGLDAVRLVGDPERPKEIWVRWHEVPDFYASGPRDRHYRLDRKTGDVLFGDGQRGASPPRGVRNVRAAVYRTGGGADGNRPAGAMSQLKTTVPYVDGVTNYEPATGGADTEPIERVKDRGPRALRHRGLAVTAEDFEDLALDASPAVARAKAITLKFDPFALDQQYEDAPAPVGNAGFVKVLIVPYSPDVPPTPTVGLLQDVEAYLRERCAPAAGLLVIGPAWIEVRVTISLVPVTFEGAEALLALVRRSLSDFLHPLTGGFDGAGWALGQTPRGSDIYRLAASIAGIENVRAAELALFEPDGTEILPDDPLTPELKARSLIYPGAHDVTLVSPQGGP